MRRQAHPNLRDFVAFKYSVARCSLADSGPGVGERNNLVVLLRDETDHAAIHP